MTETGRASGPVGWDARSGGVDWHIELDRRILLPGRLIGGRLSITAQREIEARGVVAAFIATEHWRHRVTTRSANGSTRTDVVTKTAELRRVPEQLHGPLHLAEGERWETAFDLPVPAMGPASLDARDAGLEWTIEVKLDLDNAFDAGIELPVVVAQPTALLRAGAVHVGQFALYESADVAADGITGAIALEPMPLVTGEPFTGRLELQLPGSVSLQEIRAELRVLVEATVGEGEKETITAWSSILAPGGNAGGTVSLEINGALGERPLPTIELPHGRAHATFHVILARAWSIDTHLARDVTIATTDEL